jgi:four helix bundle protein
MPLKFEKLEVWQLSLDYIDHIYEIGNELPRSEEYNLRSQMARAATSVALNIAEGSTSQTDAEQARFWGMGIRSLLETVACQHLINRREYLQGTNSLRQAYRHAEILAAKLHSMRKAIAPEQPWLREESPIYETEEEG